jgi:Na+-transporting NADH:ubiquinone oxidoreductase subunit C
MNKMVYSAGFMFLVALFFTSLVSAVKLTNENRIERNQQVKLQKTILQVLGLPLDKDPSPDETFTLFQDRIKVIDVRDKRIYVGYEKDGKTIHGYAFPVGGPGFWGPVKGMVAVDPHASRIIGIAFYKHSETPGLGGRISEEWFRRQFKGLSIYPIEGDEKIFYLTAGKPEKAPNELDAITGATGTSRAVERFLNKELDLFLKEFWGEIRGSGFKG